MVMLVISGDVFCSSTMASAANVGNSRFMLFSLPHHLPSSPLPFIITSLLHHFPSWIWRFEACLICRSTECLRCKATRCVLTLWDLLLVDLLETDGSALNQETCHSDHRSVHNLSTCQSKSKPAGEGVCGQQLSSAKNWWVNVSYPAKHNLFSDWPVFLYT